MCCRAIHRYFAKNRQTSRKTLFIGNRKQRGGGEGDVDGDRGVGGWTAPPANKIALSSVQPVFYIQ